MKVIKKVFQYQKRTTNFREGNTIPHYQMKNYAFSRPKPAMVVVESESDTITCTEMASNGRPLRLHLNS